MRKTLLPAVALSLTALGWTSTVLANPPAEHPAQPSGDHKEGEHHEGDHAPKGH